MDPANSVTDKPENALVSASGAEALDKTALDKGSMTRLLGSTDAVRRPIMARVDNALSHSVQKMWERSDDMKFKARGDRDMTQDEVSEYLEKQSNPFEPLPDDHEERMMAAIEKGDLEALQALNNVHVYQTYRDQKKDEMGDEYDEDALEEGQVAMSAKEIWSHFDALRTLRAHIVEEEKWDQLISEPKWAKFIRWYPTVAGAASDPTIPEHEVDSLRQMLEQKHMMETDSAYTRDKANAAFDVYGHGEYAMACKKAQEKAAQ